MLFFYEESFLSVCKKWGAQMSTISQPSLKTLVVFCLAAERRILGAKWWASCPCVRTAEEAPPSHPEKPVLPSFNAQNKRNSSTVSLFMRRNRWLVATAAPAQERREHNQPTTNQPFSKRVTLQCFIFFKIWDKRGGGRGG